MGYHHNQKCSYTHWKPVNAVFCHFVQVRGDVLCLALYMYILMDVPKQTNKIRMGLSLILLPAHPASFAHNFVSGMQSFYFSESQHAIVLQTCH